MQDFDSDATRFRARAAQLKEFAEGVGDGLEEALLSLALKYERAAKLLEWLTRSPDTEPCSGD